MISLSVGDILKVLDQIPLWKAVAILPRRISELEARVAALEGSRSAPAPPGPTDCPGCRVPMRFEHEADHPIFGDVGGVKVHTYVCDGCGGRVKREFTPGSGYS